MRAYATIHELFYHHLDELYAAENQIIYAISSVLPQISQPAYQDGLILYRAEALRHRDLLHEVFEALELHPADHGCSAVRSMLGELNQMLRCNKPSLIRDLALLSTFHQLCQYVLGQYQWLAQWAERANQLPIAQICTTIQQQKTYAAHILTKLCDQGLHLGLPEQLQAQTLGGFGQLPNQARRRNQKR
ncbi:DUF892 family protein [Herpetosiphon geysericola]|uniref:Uncharacterized protein n=1 Tax=Herpetosiphon geysericola TaxID=70996 RepID=A0A0P6Y5D7_9CHLR|nr:DUF892 family protein [Herpetosiphon geysericola]KPL91488.1 hypothetical protein SE18_02240 [Herpetosiphon geysericola]